MSINVAKLFATMGFNIDTTDVTKVNNVINSVKTSSNELSRKLFVMNNHLQKSQGYLSKIAKADGSGKAVGNMGSKYVSLAKSVDTARTSTSKFGRLLTTIDPRLESTGNKLTALTLKWKGLNDVIKEANTNLSQVSSRVPRSPAQAHVGIRNGRYVGQGGGGGYAQGYAGQHRYSSKDKSFLQEALGGIPLMLNPFTPSGMLAGGAITAGVALRETVSAGRERIKSKNVMLMAAEDQAQYAESLEFVRKESHRLGQDTTEMGMAFGKVLQSAKGKMEFKEVQNTFTAFGEMMVAMGSNVEDQKGVYRALTQMLSKGKIEAEEEGQMAERGLPAKELVKRAAMVTYGVDEDKYFSMRQKGQVKFEDIAPELNKMLREMANNNNALQNHLNKSMTAQARFMNTLKDGAEALMEAGLDDFLKAMFNGLTAIMPHLLSFTKGLMAAVSGLVKLGSGIVSFTKNSPAMVGVLSSIVLVLALFAQRVALGTTTFGMFANMFVRGVAVMAKAARRFIPLLILMTVFKAYDDYVNGEDNWMAVFSAWLTLLMSEVDLLSSKLALAFDRFRRYDFAGMMDALTGGEIVIGDNGLPRIATDVEKGKRNVDRLNSIGNLSPLLKSSLYLPKKWMESRIRRQENIDNKTLPYSPIVRPSLEDLENKPLPRGSYLEQYNQESTLNINIKNPDGSTYSASMRIGDNRTIDVGGTGYIV